MVQGMRRFSVGQLLTERVCEGFIQGLEILEPPALVQPWVIVVVAVWYLSLVLPVGYKDLEVHSEFVPLRWDKLRVLLIPKGLKNTL
eukprot:gene12636-biopygen3438